MGCLFGLQDPNLKEKHPIHLRDGGPAQALDARLDAVVPLTSETLCAQFTVLLELRPRK